MIKEAKKYLGQSIKFIRMQRNSIPFASNSFDLVFNSFVMLDIASKDDLILNFKEMHRVCKKGGKVITITNSDFLFSKKWKTVNNNFQENKNTRLYSVKLFEISCHKK